LTKTKILRNEDATIMIPMAKKARLAVIWRKQTPKRTEPTLPPAPTIPERDPVKGGFTYGTIL
jgi:hypothetical protein